MRSSIAQIDPGVVYLRNADCGRSWSLMRGATEELWHGDDRHEWLVARSPEFHLDVGETPCGALDCTAVDWSDRAGSGWAEVAAEFCFASLRVCVTTRLSGAVPVFERTLTVRNAGSGPVSIPRYAVEILPLDSGACRMTPVEMGAAEALRAHGPYWNYYVLRNGHRSLLLGCEKEDGILFFEPNPKFCALAGSRVRTIAPAETRVLQRTLTAPFCGSAARTLRAIASYWQEQSEADGQAS